MTARRTARTAVATAAVTLAACVGAAPPALAAPASAVDAPVDQPADVTVCRPGTVLPPLVAGDLVVEPGCGFLDGLVVRGDVRFTPDADMIFQAGRIEGDVEVGRDATVYLTLTQVRGGIRLDDARALRLESSDVARSVRGDADIVSVTRSDVAGAVNVAVPAAETAGGVVVSQSDVGGWVNVHGGVNRVTGSWLARGLTFSSVRAARVCETDVLADVTVRWSRGGVTFGGRAYDALCTDEAPPVPNTFGAGLLVVGNAESVRLRDTAVAGGLDCRNNRRGVQVAPTTAVAGARTGQCVSAGS